MGLTCQGRFFPRAGNIILHSNKPAQHWSLPVKYQMEDVNLIFKKNTPQLYLTCA